MTVRNEKKKGCRRAAPGGLLGSLLAQSCCGLAVLPLSAWRHSRARGRRLRGHFQFAEVTERHC